jgi:3-oxoacyl-[acyl-carrier-protein] synthase III
MMTGAGLRALSVQFPRGVRTNQFFRNHHADVVQSIEQKAKLKVWSGSEKGDSDSEFDHEMAQYLKDPFRGTVERRVLTPGESSLTLEKAAAEQALEAAGLAPEDVDLMIVVSFLPDSFGLNNAAFLARDLGLKRAAWNLETACAGANVALQTACGLVRAGDYDNVLVVVSCCYSRDTDTHDTISWTVGDGAGAFVIGKVKNGYGRLGQKSVHTGVTCGALWFENYVTPEGKLWFRLLASDSAGKLLRDTAKPFLLECCHGALEKADLQLSDVDHFVFNTPTAWYAKFCARSLGVDPERTIDMYPKYANIGPALLPANLFHAAREKRFKPDDIVLLYSIGSISSCGAMVMRWGDVALGHDPRPPELICD